MDAGANPALPQPAVAASHGSENGEDWLQIDQQLQRREETRMLLLGFATGMTVAAVFLLYVVLAAAGLFP